MLHFLEKKRPDPAVSFFLSCQEQSGERRIHSDKGEDSRKEMWTKSGEKNATATVQISIVIQIALTYEAEKNPSRHRLRAFLALREVQYRT